jgi:Dyp-type peroxidase family
MINTHQKSIDQRDLQFDNLFSNMQGNILKSHGRNHTTNIFVKFDGNKVNSAKRWIKEFAENITSCKTQLRETERYKRNKVSGGTFYNLYISASGYDYLGMDSAIFGDDSFKAGMKNASLNDPEVSKWEKGFREDIHAMILIGDVDSNKLGVIAKEIIEKINVFGKILTIEYGNAIRNANGDGLEHFGYVDGISQPLFFKDEVEENISLNITPLKFDPSAELDLVLVNDPFVHGEDAFGSYFVFRKLEQNVKGFKIAEKKIATELGLTGEDKERAGAMIVGRFEDGTPVTLSKENNMISSGIMNNFDYANDSTGSKCPFHAHIRKSNPRRNDSDKMHIMARRGIPFGHRNVNTEVDPSFAQMPNGDVGLLFMSFQKSIENQFEFIQKNWVNNVNFPNANNGIDPIIGQNGTDNVSTGKFAKMYDSTASLEEKSFDNFVTMKGGEYFFAPSIPFLKEII